MSEHLKLTSSLMRDSRLSDDWDQSAKTRGHEEGITLSTTQIQNCSKNPKTKFYWDGVIIRRSASIHRDSLMKVTK